MGPSFSALTLITVFLLVGTIMAVEKDPLEPRVPPDQIDAAKAMKNPIPPTPENIAKGKELYEGKALCLTCHGLTGRGDGDAGKALDPGPRDFSNPKFHKAKTDGELFWVVKNGTPGTGMISYVPNIISEEEAWTLILYNRTLVAK